MEPRFRFARLARTSSSEIYIVQEEGHRVGQVDLHYAEATVHSTIILERHLSVTSEEELITQLDDEIVSSYLSRYERQDFLITVYRGEEISSYTDAGPFDDEMPDEEDQAELEDD